MTHRKKRILKIAALLGAAGLVTFQIAVRVVPLPPDLKSPIRGTTTITDHRSNTPLTTLPTTEARFHDPVELEELGEWLPMVTIALEDHRFYEHQGIDYAAIASATLGNAKNGEVVSGASTITQQLVKLSRPPEPRTLWVKLYESLAAARLEREWTKEQILEAYLNRIHYGNRRVGAAAAARDYFGKEPAALTLSEAVFLAGIPQAPSRLNPRTRRAEAVAKYHRSISRLEELQLIPSAELGNLETAPITKEFATPNRIAPHFLDALIQANPGIAKTGREVRSTLDLPLQRKIELLQASHLRRLAIHGADHCGVIIMDSRSGAIRAMVGSRDYSGRIDGQINGTTIKRSSGSTLKPLLYLQAIDEKIITAATILPDTSEAVRSIYADYDPANYDERRWGPVRAREALANSLNIPAVVTLGRLGARNAYRGFQKCGLDLPRTFDAYGAGMVLGNAEVSLIDLTSAFTAFAGDGLAVIPRYLEESSTSHLYIASEEAVSIIGDILSDSEARRKTFGPFSPLNFEYVRIPVKTGTSSGFRDAWTVGTTHEHTVGVWIGNFSGRPMKEIASMTGPAPLWRDIINLLLEEGDSGVPPLQPGTQLQHRQVCSLTGTLPGPQTTSVINEWFLLGTDPTENAENHFRAIDGKLRLVLPANYEAWCKSQFNYLGAVVESADELKIVSPRPNSKFLLDYTLAPDQQAIPLIAVGNSSLDLLWKVNGTPVPPTGRHYYWQLSKGEHKLEVSNGGRSAKTTILVE